MGGDQRDFLGLRELAAAGAAMTGEWEGHVSVPLPSWATHSLVSLGSFTATCANPAPATHRTPQWGSSPTRCRDYLRAGSFV